MKPHKIKTPVNNSGTAMQKILDASAELIAQKGYSAVGIREIAAKAEVNIAMISYYFGGKIGILKSIMDDYNNEFKSVVKKLREKDLGLEEGTRHFVTALVELIQRKENICKVAMLEIPYEIPEIAGLKIKMMKENSHLMKDTMKKYFDIDDPIEHLIIAPVFMAIIYSNFLFAAPFQKYLNVKFNKKFYKKYSEVISNFALHGISGYSKK